MRKGKKFVVNTMGRPNSEINVTPLVDVVLVLLIIFMVVTPLLEKDIDVRVPPTEQVEELREVPKEQLVVALAADGALSLNDEPVAAEACVEKLRRVLAAKAAGDRLVFFAPVDAAPYAKLVAALDGAREAGAETLGMMTDLPPESVPGGPAPTPGVPAP